MNTAKPSYKQLGRKHCKLGMLPSNGMPEEYYVGYSEAIDEPDSEDRPAQDASRES